MDEEPQDLQMEHLGTQCLNTVYKKKKGTGVNLPARFQKMTRKPHLILVGNHIFVTTFDDSLFMEHIPRLRNTFFPLGTGTNTSI